MRIAIVLAALAALCVGAFFTRGYWLPNSTVEKNDPTTTHEHSLERIKLTPQARANLKLAVKPVQPQTFRRSVQVPGEVVERRGRGDQSFTAPVTGVVKSIAAFPGDTVEVGSALLTLKLTSEPMQTSQLELYKAAMETKISFDQKKRLESMPETVAKSQIVDVQNHLARLAGNRRAYRADLALKGLTPEQIDSVEEGNFIREIVVRVPSEPDSSLKPLLELQELKVFQGDQVQAGQLLGLLSNHQNLYIEGRGFREDTSLLEQTAAKGWPLTAIFPEEAEGAWPTIDFPIKILYLSNTIDPTSQTLPFYVSLPNQYLEYDREGKRFRIWRFRPGQRVQLGVPVQEYRDVFVLPSAAVTREGANAYVFQRNGDWFERKPVHVVFEDSRFVAVANDGSILTGAHIAQNGAGAINRAFKAQNAEGGSGGCGHEH